MFVKDKIIRFQHCDPAGIVFYPHYFVLMHELVEDWFTEGIGQSYAQFVKQHGMGLPMVKVECEFLTPNSIGDVISLGLSVKRIGGSSIVLHVRGTARGRESLRSTLTVVHASLRDLRPVRVPDELRSAMARFMES
ncbi:MAG: acyl-CoA thioesterase [Burkholderiaceae bacterium]|nr:acyl-CoA thioesterase [Burkholderiaceae bacterium]